MRKYQFYLLALALAIVAAACASSTVDADTTQTTSSSTTTSTSPPSMDKTPTTVDRTTTTPVPSTTIPPIHVDSALLVANEDGAFLVDDEFLFQLVTGPVELALDDGEGGLVFQRSSDGFYGPDPDPTATIVEYLPANSFEPHQLLVPTGDQYLKLRDVSDGAVWYTREEGLGFPETALETLRTYDLASRAVRSIAATGGWESGAVEVSVGGTNVVAYWFSEASSGFAFFDNSGGPVEVAGDPYKSDLRYCGDGTLYEYTDSLEESWIELDQGCYGYAELSDDGRLAYLESTFDGVLLVVVDLESGEELFRQDLNRPDEGWLPRTVDLNSDMAIVNRKEGGTYRAPHINALLIDLESGDVSEVGLSGQARFLTGPMRIS